MVLRPYSSMDGGTDAKRQKLYGPDPAPIADHPDLNALRGEGFTGPYEPLGRVIALEVTPELFEKYVPAGEFMAAWGESEVVRKLRAAEAARRVAAKAKKKNLTAAN